MTDDADHRPRATDADARSAVRIELFGAVRVTVGTAPPVVLTGRMAALVGLAAARGVGPDLEQPRDAVAFRLWPDHGEDEARRALVGTIYRLRQAVPDGAPWLIADRRTIALRGVWVDLVAFRELAEGGTPTGWQGALEVATGDALVGIDDEWADETRTAVRERCVALLARLVADREAADDLAEALTWARRWIAADPFDEAAVQAVMRLYARSGRPAAALDQYAALVDRLAAELDVPPDPATTRLAEHIRADHEAGATSLDVVSRPLVGRDAERRRLLETLDRAVAARGGLAVVIGEPGIGKTRLLTELEASAEWRGWRIGWGRGDQFGLPEPFAPLGMALRAAVPGARRAQLLRLLDPGRRRTLGALLPEAGPGPSPASAAATGGPDADAWDDAPAIDRIADALGAALAELGGLAPQLLLLDDVQWGDPLLLPLLDAARPGLARSRVLVVLSARADEIRGIDPAREQLEAWDRDGVPVLSLRGLDDAALAALSAGMDGRDRTPQELAALAAASGGNPLLALALVDAGEDSAALAEPASGARADLDRLFERRLRALSPRAMAALEAAAVVGQRVDDALWSEVSGDPDLAVPASELEAAGLLRLDGDAYVFRHDTLRGLVIWGLGADRRAELDRAALESRRRRTPDDALALLYHAERLGDAAEIATYAQRAGEEALRGLAFAAAARHFGQALHHLPPEARQARAAALLGRVRALEVLADREAQRTDVQELEDLAEHLDEKTRLDAAIQRATFHLSVGEYAECAAVAERTLAGPAAAADPRRQVTLLTLLGRIQREQGRTAACRATLTRAGALARRIGDRHGEAMATELLAGLAWRTGDHRTAAAQHAEAARMFEATGDRRRAANALNSVGTALWSLGDYDGARRAHERSLATCRAIGDRRGEGDNLDNLGGVAWALADFEQAIELYGAALAIRRASHDPWGITISLSNIADTEALLGDFEASFAHFDESLEADRAIGVQRNEAHAWHGKGRAQLAAGLPEEALRSLGRALELHAAIGDRDGRVDGLAAQARAYVAAGDVPAARAAMEGALGLLESTDRPALREWVHLAAWIVRRADGDERAAAAHLAGAAAAMDDLLAALPEDARDRVRTRVPIHRETGAARAAARTMVEVRLPRDDVPLGRALGDADLVTVRWTLVDPVDALQPDAATRRQTVLRRLVDEASAQGAAPTDDDLAEALGVSRRTVLRDAEALAAAGRPLATRARVRREVTPA